MGNWSEGERAPVTKCWHSMELSLCATAPGPQGRAGPCGPPGSVLSQDKMPCKNLRLSTISSKGLLSGVCLSWLGLLCSSVKMFSIFANCEKGLVPVKNVFL